jgi:serine/threonine protein kinase
MNDFVFDYENSESFENVMYLQKTPNINININNEFKLQMKGQASTHAGWIDSPLVPLYDLFPFTEPLSSLVQDTDTILGKGSQATIKLGYLKEKKESTTTITNRQKVALKYIYRKPLEADPTGITRLVAEIQALSSSHHPNIIGFYGFSIEPEHIVLVMEYAEKGDLFDYLIHYLKSQDSKKTLPEDVAATIFIDMLRAVEYLHLLGIVHRDIKPENFLMDSKGVVKLADFGFCKIEYHERLQTPCGSLVYAAPEIFNGESYLNSVDVYSLGICLYVILNARSPWGDKSERRIRESIKNGWFQPFEEHVSESARDLFFAMVKMRPEDRVTAHQALYHPWARKFLLQPVRMDQYMEMVKRNFSSPQGVRKREPLSPKKKSTSYSVVISSTPSSMDVGPKAPPTSPVSNINALENEIKIDLEHNNEPVDSLRDSLVNCLLINVDSKKKRPVTPTTNSSIHYFGNDATQTDSCGQSVSSTFKEKEKGNTRSGACLTPVQADIMTPQKSPGRSRQNGIAPPKSVGRKLSFSDESEKEKEKSATFAVDGREMVRPSPPPGAAPTNYMGPHRKTPTFSPTKK